MKAFSNQRFCFSTKLSLDNYPGGKMKKSFLMLIILIGCVGIASQSFAALTLTKGCAPLSALPTISGVNYQMPAACPNAPAGGSCITVKWTASNFTGATNVQYNVTLVLTNASGASSTFNATAAGTATSVVIPENLPPGNQAGSAKVTVNATYSGCATASTSGTLSIAEILQDVQQAFGN
jgi:hypothetical protein